MYEYSWVKFTHGHIIVNENLHFDLSIQQMVILVVFHVLSEC